MPNFIRDNDQRESMSFPACRLKHLSIVTGNRLPSTKSCCYGEKGDRLFWTGEDFDDRVPLKGSQKCHQARWGKWLNGRRLKCFIFQNHRKIRVRLKNPGFWGRLPWHILVWFSSKWLTNFFAVVDCIFSLLSNWFQDFLAFCSVDAESAIKGMIDERSSNEPSASIRAVNHCQLWHCFSSHCDFGCFFTVDRRHPSPPGHIKQRWHRNINRFAHQSFQ
jgi:hypothetical protein